MEILMFPPILLAHWVTLISMVSTLIEKRLASFTWDLWSWQTTMTVSKTVMASVQSLFPESLLLFNSMVLMLRMTF